MNQFILTTMAFGRTSEYKRAILAILSAYALLSVAKECLLVVFYTDNPLYFSNWFHGLNVQIHELNESKIKALCGKLDFIHNIKIGIIDETLAKFPNNSILYIDADTFFIADPIIAFKRINFQTSCMYAHEYQF